MVPLLLEVLQVLPQVVSSTLGAEAQSFSTACALAEWMSLMVVEARHGAFDLRSVRDMPQTPIVSNLAPKPDRITGNRDCKSLYDHLSRQVGLRLKTNGSP